MARMGNLFFFQFNQVLLQSVCIIHVRLQYPVGNNLVYPDYLVLPIVSAIDTNLSNSGIHIICFYENVYDHSQTYN